MIERITPAQPTDRMTVAIQAVRLASVTIRLSIGSMGTVIRCLLGLPPPPPPATIPRSPPPVGLRGGTPSASHVPGQVEPRVGRPDRRGDALKRGPPLVECRPGLRLRH